MLPISKPWPLALGPELPPVEYHVRRCLKCDQMARMPRTRRTCDDCWQENRLTLPGLYGIYGPGSGFRRRRRSRATWEAIPDTNAPPLPPLSPVPATRAQIHGPGEFRG